MKTILLLTVSLIAAAAPARAQRFLDQETKEARKIVQESPAPALSYYDALGRLVRVEFENVKTGTYDQLATAVKDLVASADRISNVDKELGLRMKEANAEAAAELIQMLEKARPALPTFQGDVPATMDGLVRDTERAVQVNNDYSAKIRLLKSLEADLSGIPSRF